MPDWTSEQIAQAAFDRDLIDDQNLRELWGELGSQQADPNQFGQALIRRGLLTNYQLKKLQRGDRHGYFYGPYKVLYKVGSGTFARVFRAVNRETQEVRAVKVLRPEHHHQDEMREQFIREGEMGQALRHPNIVPIFEVKSDSHHSYFVMEFIEGQNLREFLKSRNHFVPAEATRLAIDICRGLDYAFQRGVSHRDLKASNVLVSSLGQAKLLDFGLAGADPDLSDAELEKIENPRTIDYAALERATGVRKDDQRSDIFFLGCIYYQMLCGKPALEETKDRIARMSRNRFEALKPILEVMPNLSRDVAAVVSKAAMLDPEKRYQTPAEMLADLLAVSHYLSGNGNGKSMSSGETLAKPRAVMLVESNANLQETLRSHFKEKGFRVLVTADPQRPSSLFTETNLPADCVIFCTSSLGEESLDAFNAFGDSHKTKHVPSILLLGPKHGEWVNRAKTNDWRATVTTPIKMKRLLALFEQMLPAAKQA
jgi:serine/threonine-protein kinase